MFITVSEMFICGSPGLGEYSRELGLSGPPDPEKRGPVPATNCSQKGDSGCDLKWLYNHLLRVSTHFFWKIIFNVCYLSMGMVGCDIKQVSQCGSQSKCL